MTIQAVTLCPAAPTHGWQLFPFEAIPSTQAPHAGPCEFPEHIAEALGPRVPCQGVRMPGHRLRPAKQLKTFKGASGNDMNPASICTLRSGVMSPRLKPPGQYRVERRKETILKNERPSGQEKPERPTPVLEKNGSGMGYKFLRELGWRAE